MTRALDLFSGAGGFTCGATQAGAVVVWAANHWPEAVDCHAANHPTVAHVTQDLAEMDWTRCPQASLLLASPACQGHSQAGQPARKGTGGNFKPDPVRLRLKGQRDRNTSWAVLAAADTIRPETILVENVADLQRWEAFEAWLGVLQSFGYQTRTHTLNGLHYGGAQDRPRTVVTASLGKPIDLVPSLEAPRCIQDCLDPDDIQENNWTDIGLKSARMLWRMRKAQREAGARCFWANVSESRGRPLDEPFPTATTKSGSQWYLLDGDRGRVLNPREIARSMSFPSTYKLPRARGLAGELLGNAIDVRLARGMVSQALN